MSTDLPADIVSVLDYLALEARDYDNHLKWDEEAKLEADLMHNRARRHSPPGPSARSEWRLGCVAGMLCRSPTSSGVHGQAGGW